MKQLQPYSFILTGLGSWNETYIEFKKQPWTGMEFEHNGVWYRVTGLECAGCDKNGTTHTPLYWAAKV